MKLMIDEYNNLVICYKDGGFAEVKKNVPEPRQPQNSAVNDWTRKIGHALIDHVDIQIGGASIDRQYGNWLDLWQELSSK